MYHIQAPFVSIMSLRVKYFNYMNSYKIKYRKNYMVIYNVFEEKMKEIIEIINEYQLEYKVSKYKTDCIIIKSNEEQIFYFKLNEVFEFNKEKWLESF